MADRGGDLDQPVHLGAEAVLDDPALGLLDHAGERDRLAGELAVEPGQDRSGLGVREQATHAEQGVVAGRPRARPVPGQRLVALEDLLDHDPCAGRAVEPHDVAARVRQAVGVVDPQPLHVSLGHEGEQHGMGLGEDTLVLDADAHQGVDVEEAPVVELLVADPPVREPVELAVQQLLEREPGRARPDREHVVEVAQPRLAVVLLDRDLAVVHALTDAPAQNRHQDGALLRGPVHVEPVRVRRGGPVLEDRPQRRVEIGGRRHGHVVGHDVDHDAHPAARRLTGQVVERGRAAEVVAEAVVVDDVVAVGGSGSCLQDRRQVGVGHPERVEVLERLLGVAEAELRAKLQAVGAGGRRLGHQTTRRSTRIERASTVTGSPARADGRSSTSGAAVSVTTSHRSP